MNILARYMKETKTLEERNLKILSKEIDKIIKKSIKDIDVIEHLLDTLLSFSFVDSSEEFNRLNDYYEKVNKENSEDYKLIYRAFKDYDE